MIRKKESISALKIVFIGLASTYTPGMTYQDNYLCQVAVADGHQVTYISNPEKYVNGKVVPTGFEDEILPDGMHLIRPPYCKLGPSVITRKIRKFKGIYHILEQAQPNVIFCHNTQYWSILDVIRYKKNHPSVRLYADSHTDANNSGTNWLSLHLLHRVFYRYLVQKALPHLERYFYITQAVRQFVKKNYGVDDSKLEFYPLGGMVFPHELYEKNRCQRREELGIAADEVLFVHAGKLRPIQRTEELLEAFSAVPNPKAKMIIIGLFADKMDEILQPLIQADGRIMYLGWKTGEELQEYLCAGDMYCQPGGQTSTVQNAICCGCAMMLFPSPSYAIDYDCGNVRWVSERKDMEQVFLDIKNGSVDLCAMKENSFRCARDVLDYAKLAARIYH